MFARRIAITAILAVVSVCFTLLAAPATAQPSIAGPSVYVLKDASFERGCFDPCDCLLEAGERFRGTFVLRPRGTSGNVFRYAVEDVNWYVDFQGAEIQITGSGVYKRISGVAGWVHEMTLKLSIDGAEAEEFSSGSVPGGANFPDITGLTLSMNGLFCFDTAITINAGVAPVRCYTLDDRSTYQEGCLPPCLCPIFLEQPLVGRFGLVEIANYGTWIEYAIVNVNWKVKSTFDPPSSTFRGFGRYTRVSGFAGWFHFMELQLSVDGAAPIAFESGYMDGGGEFPLINIAVAMNGFYCYDIVLDLHARPCVWVDAAADAAGSDAVGAR